MHGSIDLEKKREQRRHEKRRTIRAGNHVIALADGSSTEKI
jgi:hypothetical protein